ncbi:Replication protein A 70 kDa DNA-binding subunit [Auxenochlorella protothecoides]|uniref:Replication protein A subunit n=1 Tax=Auxenochlorella protothecoides TaxID=3075 RepID=A0A087SB55_AUXPR|nr:Replication protein A 70 kDa DNA-binding subunit [Auxenochlorella protothecoides]KFM22959.1 Replication protein A 70 kDa DNA-binding subunit [Auxenochlorella protothecoides]
MQLSRGAIAGILSDGPPQVYTVQCAGVKKVMNPNGQPRYRLMLSDGEFQYVCMLASQLSDLVVNQLQEGCILQITEYICQFVQTKKYVQQIVVVVVIVLNCKVVQAECPKIGNPVMYTDPSVVAAPGTAQPSAAAPAPFAAPQHAAHPASAYGAPPATGPAPAYGAPPPTGSASAYGAPPSAGAAPAYGAPPASAAPAYGAPPASAAPAYGAPPQHAGTPYGVPAPVPSAYGAPPQGTGPAAAAPYAVPPSAGQQGPYGAPQSAGAYGVPPAATGPYGGHSGAAQYGAAVGGGPKAAYGASAYQQQGPKAEPANPYGGGGGGIPAAYPPTTKAYGNPSGPPQYRGQGAVARDAGPASIMPINSLNSYQNRWTIKARVTHKSDIRRYTNARGEGRFFSFDLLDAQGGEIRAVGWNDQCDKWYEAVDTGKVYLVSKASLRNKRGNFNQTRHQFEIHLENGSQVEPVQDEAEIPQLHFNFTSISQLEDVPAGQMVDVVGVVDSVQDWTSITKRDGGETQKRSMIIRDESGRSIEVTLWGAYALTPGDSLQATTAAGTHPVLAVKNARVGDFNGKTLSTVSSSTVLIDPPDVAEAARLRAWYDQGGCAQAAAALSKPSGGGGRADRRVTLSQIADEGLGLGGQPAWVQVVATVAFLRNENMYYPACPLPFNGKTCNKKLQDHTGDGNFYCERCGQNATPDWRYIVSMQVADHSGEIWVTAFNEAAPELIGVPAGELRQLCEDGNPRFAFLVQQACFKTYTMKLKVAEDTYNDETKIRISLVSATAPDYGAESRTLLDLIGKLQRGEQIFGPPVPAAGGPGALPGVARGGAPPAQQQGYGGGYGAPAPRPAIGGYGDGGAARGGYGAYGGTALANAGW